MENTLNLGHLLEQLEEFRLAAQATDARVHAARDALRDVLHGYAKLYESLSAGPGRDMFRQLLGAPLERAAHALNLEA